MASESVAAKALKLGRAMAEMRSLMRQHIQTKIKEHNINLTFEMLEVMACLWKQDGINQQEIADITIKDKSSMTYLVDNLVKRNMVERVPDENDRRNNLIYLTEKGRQLRQTTSPWLVDMYAIATAGITGTDIQKAIDLVKKMTGNLNA